MPVKIEKYFSQAKQQLNEPYTELIGTNFLLDVKWNKTDKDFIICYYPGKRAFEDYKQKILKTNRQLEIPLEIDFNNKKPKVFVDKMLQVADFEIKRVTDLLATTGVSQSVAQNLSSEYGKEKIVFREKQYNLIEFEIEYYKWAKLNLYEENRPRGPQWLRKAIEEKWLPSDDGFKTEIEKKEEKEKMEQFEKLQKEDELRRIEEESKRRYMIWLNMTSARR